MNFCFGFFDGRSKYAQLTVICGCQARHTLDPELRPEGIVPPKQLLKNSIVNRTYKDRTSFYSQLHIFHTKTNKWNLKLESLIKLISNDLLLYLP
jgi:hypothetical protein